MRQFPFSIIYQDFSSEIVIRRRIVEGQINTGKHRATDARVLEYRVSNLSPQVGRTFSK